MAAVIINNHSDLAISRYPDHLKDKPNAEALLRSKASARIDVIDVDNPDDFIVCVNGQEFLYSSLVNDTPSMIASELLSLINAETDKPLVETFEYFDVGSLWEGEGALGNWAREPIFDTIDLGGFTVQDEEVFGCFKGIRSNFSRGVVAPTVPEFFFNTGIVGYQGRLENIQRMQIEIKFPPTFPGPSLKGVSGHLMPIVFRLRLPTAAAASGLGWLIYKPDGGGGYEFEIQVLIPGITPATDVIVNIPEAALLDGDWHKITLDWWVDGTWIEADVDDGAYNNTIVGFGALPANPISGILSCAVDQVNSTLFDIPEVWYDNFFVGNKGGEKPFQISSLKLDTTEDSLYVRSTTGVTGEELLIQTTPNMSWNYLGIVDQIQELENVFFDLLLNRSLDTASGVQLDVLGRIVGESRQGKNDADYRLFISARITRNLSEGTAETLLQVLLVMSASDSAKLSEFFPASVQLDFDGEVPSSPTSFLALMDEVAAGGVKVILNKISPDNQGFVYSSTLAPVSGSDRGYGSTVSAGGGEYAGIIGEE